MPSTLRSRSLGGSGTGNLNPDPWVPAAAAPLRSACAVVVYRYDAAEGTMTPLPNVECLAVQASEGPDPGSAEFRYRFDGFDAEAPQSAEQALSTAFTVEDLPHLVEVGDRLCVRVTRPDGVFFWLFDGYPLDWGVDLSGGSEVVTMTATGVAKRLWDTPVSGARWRDSDDPEEGDSDVDTDLVPQFNPRGVANASPSTGDSGSDPYNYPVFADPDNTGTDADGEDYPRSWDLPMAVAYLLYVHNGEAGASPVVNPKRTELDGKLVGREPIDGTPFDPTDHTTYTKKPIPAADAPLAGKALPVLVHDLVKDAGFGMKFDLTAETGTSFPTTALDLFLKQAAPVRSVYLAARLTPLDAGANNVAAARLSRDLTGVVNRWTVDGALDRYEATFVLACGFPATAVDATASNLHKYDASDSAFATSAAFDAYRLWVLDEDGSGHFPNAAVGNTSAAKQVTGTATTLDAVLGAPDTSTVPPTEKYVARRRAPVGTLFSVDSNGKPLRARLSISKDYPHAAPGVWDSSGTQHWQHVEGGWELLKDRIGVRLTTKHPNLWNVGKCEDTSAPYPDGKVNVVEAMGNPTTAKPAFWLRLTCVLEADRGLKAVADRQDTSPLSQVIERRVDARDRFKVETIAAGSELNTGAAVKPRDDTDLAKAEAIAYRTATEAGVFEGEVEIPFLTMYYRVGDRVDRVRGRDLGLRTDTGGTGYAPVYPSVVGVRWDLLRQTTSLALSDAGLDRRRYSRKKKAPPRAESRHPAPVVGDFRPAGGSLLA